MYYSTILTFKSAISVFIASMVVGTPSKDAHTYMGPIFERSHRHNPTQNSDLFPSFVTRFTGLNLLWVEVLELWIHSQLGEALLSNASSPSSDLKALSLIFSRASISSLFCRVVRSLE